MSRSPGPKWESSPSSTASCALHDALGENWETRDPTAITGFLFQDAIAFTGCVLNEPGESATTENEANPYFLAGRPSLRQRTFCAIACTSAGATRGSMLSFCPRAKTMG